MDVRDWLWLISLLGAVGAIGAAVAAWESAKETRKTSLAQIIMQITDVYSSPEMLEGMRNLRWQQENVPDFAKKFGEMRNKDYSKVAPTDKARRMYAHYFHKIKLLLDTGLVTGNFVKKVVTSGQVDFLLEVIEPLEEAMNPNYDRSMFNTFKKLYNKSDKAR